ncbi:MAG TPA: alpha-amylase family glycosyl hydrolase [Cytophagaceae bacterium]|jgi:alpha-amylase|nr:alpha-amylase family glycosyl hydrolase [Cytophagaceae bacterium]
MKSLSISIIGFILLSFPVMIKAQPANNWWNNNVFYEVFVRSFYDSNADGIGDFNGITAKLDYLNDGDSTTTSDLGINGIWLMPMNPSPSYHGYDVTNYKDVNSQYGTKADFKNLVTKAHNRGIKVIIDFVINHTSSQHPWFVKSAANDPFYRGFYRWSDTLPTYKGPWGQTVWYPDNGSYYYAVFWSGMPDLNYAYQPVKDSIYSAAKYWIDSADIDGFRLDAAMYLYENGSSLKNQPETYQFWTDFNAYCKSIKPSFMLVGEVWDPSTTIKTYNNVIDYCFEFNLASSILSTVNSANVTGLVSAADYAYNNLQNNEFGTFLTNHDQNRVIDQLSGSLPKMKVAASIYLTLPGNPYLYYGEEVGMKGSGADQYKRTPMQWTSGTNGGFSTSTPWEALNTNYTTYNVQTMTGDNSSIYNYYKKLIQVRNKYQGIKNGTYQNIPTSDNSVYAFVRQTGAEKFIVMINTANRTISNLSMNLSSAGIADSTYRMADVLNNTIEQMAVVNSTATGISLLAYESKIVGVSGVSAVTSVVGPADNQTRLNIYPNPGRDILNIEIQNLNTGKESVVELYNTLGELTASFTLQANQINMVSIANLPTGVYYIKTADGKAVKFLKQ